MSSKVRVELNSAGVRDMLQNMCADLISEKTQQVAESANAACTGFESEVSVRGSRVVGFVHAATPHAYHHTLKNNTLLKALK